MFAHDLSFQASWKMLTRDKGWIKPILVLTLVGWIPILGQIVLLGYAFEWARLTAWGVDSATKQRGVDYGKVLTTGGRAFVISLAVNIALSIIESLVFGIEAGTLGLFGTSGSVLGNIALVGAMGGAGVVAVACEVVNMLMGTFIMVASLRATVYDDFSAGWRLDRIFQMISSDLGGFMRVYVISLLAGLVNWLYSMVLSVLAAIVFMGGAAGVMAYGYGAGMMGHGVERALVQALLGMGPAVLLLVVVLAVVAMFVGGAISTAMQLVTINATGQWFVRFDLPRWGVSSAPLPDGVPLAKGFSVPRHPANGSSSPSPQQATASDVPVEPERNAEGSGSEASAARSGDACASGQDVQDAPREDAGCADATSPIVNEAVEASDEEPAVEQSPVESDEAPAPADSAHGPILLPPVSELFAGEPADADDEDGSGEPAEEE